MSDSALILLKEWNAARLMDTHQGSNIINVPNSIACPSCGQELVDDNRTHRLLSIPAQYHIHCQNTACGWRGSRFV